MKLPEALNQISHINGQRAPLLTKHDLGVVLMEHGDTLSSTVKRLSKYGALTKVANGLYATEKSKHTDGMLYMMVTYLRPDEVNYLSNESVLCNLSIISQQMLDRITVMTTGRSGTFKTPFGVIEFTHTKRDPASIAKSTFKPNGVPIRMANKHVAVRDLKRIGRNINMIDWEEFNEAD